MRIYICDDEVQMVKQIGEKTRLVVPECSIKEFTSGEALWQALKEEAPEVLLLDIDMPNIDGLAVAGLLKTLPQSPLLVFVTSHDELVYDSLQFHPFGFVRKNFLEPELSKVLKDCREELQSKRTTYHFKCSEGEVCLPISQIQFFEADGNYLMLHTRENCYRLRETLSVVQEELGNQGFVRVHKGFLVNMAAVELMGGNHLNLEGGSSVPIGRGYAEEAKKQIMRYMLR